MNMHKNNVIQNLGGEGIHQLFVPFFVKDIKMATLAYGSYIPL